MRLLFLIFDATLLFYSYVIVVGTIYCALIAYQLLACLAIVYEWAFMMNAVTKLLNFYAAGGEVGRIDDTSD